MLARVRADGALEDVTFPRGTEGSTAGTDPELVAVGAPDGATVGYVRREDARRYREGPQPANGRPFGPDNPPPPEPPLPVVDEKGTLVGHLHAGVGFVPLEEGRPGFDPAEPAASPTTAGGPPPGAAEDASGAGAGTDRFCERFAALDREVPEDFVGSDEHLARLDELGRLAPAEVAGGLGTIRGHLADHVDPSEPDSDRIENYPGEVRRAVERVEAYRTERC